MSLWILTTCLSLLPGYLATALPIIVPTAATTTASAQPQNSGPLLIVSRLGTTLAPFTTMNITTFGGDNARELSYNSAVRIFRSHKNPIRKNETKTYVLDNIRKTNDTNNIIKTLISACVPVGTCIRNRIDVRIVTPQVPCPTGQEYCGGISTSTSGNLSIVSCGVTQSVPLSPIILEPDQAGFGEIPWQGALMVMSDYITGIVLIDGLNALTVAHKVSSYLVSGLPEHLKVRLGDQTKVLDNPMPYQEYSVVKVFSHPMYNANTLENDIAVLRLASEVPFTSSLGAAVSINRACLPPSSSTVYTGKRCAVSGRFYQMFGPRAFVKEIRKKENVSIIDPETCETQLKATRLGPNFKLNSSSFVCARRNVDEGACTDDGGSGLLCEVDGKWQIVGLFTRGHSCGSAMLPGVYVNVASYLPWIQEKLATK